MHKGVIILVKASNRDNAISKVEKFLEPYGEGKVWDWYSIGNRWHNTLAPKDKVARFKEKAKKLYPQLEGGYIISEIENEEVRPIIQSLWETEGLTGKNPYWSSYGFDVKDTENDYNVVPLSDCIDTVKEWVLDLNQQTEDYFQKMIKAKKKEKNDDWPMSAYYAGLYKDAKYGNFCFETNVYNIEEDRAESIPVAIAEYWAVMIDMHN